MASTRKKRATKAVRISVAVTADGKIDVLPMAKGMRNPIDPWLETGNMPTDVNGQDFDPDLTHYVTIEAEVPLPNSDTVPGVRKGRAQLRD